MRRPVYSGKPAKSKQTVQIIMNDGVNAWIPPDAEAADSDEEQSVESGDDSVFAEAASPVSSASPGSSAG